MRHRLSVCTLIVLGLCILRSLVLRLHRLILRSRPVLRLRLVLLILRLHRCRLILWSGSLILRLDRTVLRLLYGSRGRRLILRHRLRSRLCRLRCRLVLRLRRRLYRLIPGLSRSVLRLLIRHLPHTLHHHLLLLIVVHLRSFLYLGSSVSVAAILRLSVIVLLRISLSGGRLRLNRRLLILRL